jgi:hypothetical protein
MSTSKKIAATIRQGGPGASHENAKAPLQNKKPPADSGRRRRSSISGGGGERDSHHSHDPERKGGGSRPYAKAKRTHTGRESEFPVSRHGHHQESDHNKHNRGGQRGHKPQKHGPDEEKQ